MNLDCMVRGEGRKTGGSVHSIVLTGQLQEFICKTVFVSYRRVWGLWKFTKWFMDPHVHGGTPSCYGSGTSGSLRLATLHSVAGSPGVYLEAHTRSQGDPQGTHSISLAQQAGEIRRSFLKVCCSVKCWVIAWSELWLNFPFICKSLDNSTVLAAWGSMFLVTLWLGSKFSFGLLRGSLWWSWGWGEEYVLSQLPVPASSQ